MLDSRRINPQGVDPEPMIVAAIVALIRVHGSEQAAVLLGMGERTVLRLAAALPVRRATLALVREWLAARAPSQPSGAPMSAHV